MRLGHRVQDQEATVTATLPDVDSDWTDSGTGPGYLRARPATISLDQPPRPALLVAPTRRRVARPWLAAAGLGLVAALLGGMLLARPAASAPTGARPLIMLSAESLQMEIGVDLGATVPTAYVWYADGTRGSAGIALQQPWRPDRPVRMVTLVAGVSCGISIDEQLVVVEAAPVNRVALCVWTAPAS